MGLPDIPIDAIVALYKQNFDWLHQATSRQVVVFAQPHQSGCLNHSGYDFVNKRAFNFYNPANPFSTSSPTIIPSLGISGVLNIPFSGGMNCPVCNGEGQIYSPSSGTMLARIQWRNQDSTFHFDKTKLQLTDADVRLKITGIADVSLMDRAKEVLIDGQMCKMTKVRVPVGLRDIHTYYYYFNLL